jgi:hypothetical protein
MNVNVKYTPGSQDPWSQAPAKKVPVGTGTTTLNWDIQVIPASAGTIVFNTATSTPGIQFTGTGNSAWPGSIPTGDANGWSSSITNSLPPGSQSRSFHYKVNAIYTPSGGAPVNLTWDPDVEENPPSITIG